MADYLGLILLAVLIISFFLDKVFVYPYFPGVLALVPCLATAGLIYINQEKTKISSLLSLKTVVWVGKISYSLYLWHWVVLAIMRYIYQDSEMPMMWNVLAVVMMIGLSVLTYYFVENPLRKLQWPFGRNLVCFYVIPSVVVLGLVYEIKNTQFKNRELIYPKDICHNVISDNCIKGDLTKAPKLLFVGNSHIGQLNPWIDKVGKAEGWSAVVVSSDSFPFAFDMEWDKEIVPYYRSAKRRDKYFMENYKDYPVIVFHYEEQDHEEFKSKFLETIKKLNEESKKVYITTSVVRANMNPLRHHYLKNKKMLFRELEINKIENDLYFAPESLGVNWIDLTPYVPEKFYIDGKPVLVDSHHWNVYGAEKMADIFINSGQKFLDKKDLE